MIPFLPVCLGELEINTFYHFNNVIILCEYFVFTSACPQI